MTRNAILLHHSLIPTSSLILWRVAYLVPAIPVFQLRQFDMASFPLSLDGATTCHTVHYNLQALAGSGYFLLPS